MRASIDQLVAKLERQVVRYRQKARHEHERHEPPPADQPPALSEEDAVIVKKKQFPITR